MWGGASRLERRTALSDHAALLVNLDIGGPEVSRTGYNPVDPRLMLFSGRMVHRLR